MSTAWKPDEHNTERLLHVAHDVVDAARRNTHAFYEACSKAPEPRWPAILASLTIGSLPFSLPRALEQQFGPRWLPLVAVIVLLIPTWISFRVKRHDINQVFGFSALGVGTVTLIYTLTLLVLSFSRASDIHLSPQSLLVSAAALWVSNILVFALWYWRLDAGGPNARDKRGTHRTGAFLFPQMTLSDEAKTETHQIFWSPNFVDYLFLAFNHSTALSPTDTAILSRWAKVLIMLQALISLTIVALVAAHAVNSIAS